MKASYPLPALAFCICVFLLTGCSSTRSLLNYSRGNNPRYVDNSIVRGYINPEGTIKVLSYNIKYALKVEQAIDIIFENPDLTDADIILLQEMDSEGVKKIAATLGYNYVYYPAVRHPLHGKDFGNAVLSKGPIIDDQKIILPSFNGKKERIAVGATTLLNGQKITAYSVHLGVFVKPDERKLTANKIIESLPQGIDYCVVGGDFNTFTKADKQKINDAFQNSKFRIATRGLGWTQKQWFLFNKKTALDHIFTKGMSVKQTGKIIDHSASDHIPIWTELALQNTNKRTLIAHSHHKPEPFSSRLIPTVAQINHPFVGTSNRD